MRGEIPFSIQPMKKLPYISIAAGGMQELSVGMKGMFGYYQLQTVTIGYKRLLTVTTR